MDGHRLFPGYFVLRSSDEISRSPGGKGHWLGGFEILYQERPLSVSDPITLTSPDPDNCASDRPFFIQNSTR
jgi:hypothetical protein